MKKTNNLRGPTETRRPLPVALAVAGAWCAVLGSASWLLAAEDAVNGSAAPVASVSPLPAAGADRIPDKARRYAQRLLKHYDANADGKLQRDEWSKMHGNPDAIDVNGDGLITQDELLNAIAAYGRNRRIGQPDSAAAASPRDNPDSSNAGPAAATVTPPAGANLPSATAETSRGGATFHVPKSRFPAGLPDWFPRRDLDGDGQLSLAEFAPNPTQADLEEFTRYDRNGDGFITVEEYLGPVKPSGGKTATTGKGRAKKAEKGDGTKAADTKAAGSR